MPLTLNVGLSRKTSENYNSKGVSINLTAELDQALLTKPDELLDRVAALYGQAEEALERQQNPQSSPQQAQKQKQHGNGNGRNGDGMTTSQRKAIGAICKRLDINAIDEAKHEYGLDLDRMTIREASKLIDHLKALQPAGNGRNRSGSNGGRR
jgi:hypothetical protein